MATKPTNPTKQTLLSRKTSFKTKEGPFGGETISKESIAGYGINSKDAIRLRGKFLEHNEKIKKTLETKGIQIPAVLIPKHRLIIYRHVKEYDPETGYLKQSGIFGKDDAQARNFREAQQKAQDAAQAGISGAADALKGFLPGQIGDSAIDAAKNAISTAVEKSQFVTHEADIKFIEVEPVDGYNDFLGIKFQYTYDQVITNFTISFNNERGKNRRRFASGDVIEFYFDLVSENILMELEKDKISIKKSDIKMDLPLVFTGVLEEYSCNENSDGLTIDWSGRNAAYILSERTINYNYPNLTEVAATSVNSMSYEEIIWNMIAYNTGMVVGEVDLGNKKVFSYMGRIGAQATESASSKTNEASSDLGESMDLMDVRGISNAATSVYSRKLSNSDIFKEKLAEVLKKHKFCHTVDANGVRRPRWSCLLEFDLIRPKIFSTIEIFDSAGSSENTSHAQGILGSYRYGNEQGFSVLPPTARFKTAWGREVFALQYELVQKNYGAVLEYAPIKTETRTDAGELIRAIPITRDLVGALGGKRSTGGTTTSGQNLGGSNAQTRTILEHIFKDLQTKAGLADLETGGNEFDPWYERTLQIYKDNSKGVPSSEFSPFTITPPGAKDETGSNKKYVNSLGGLNFNRDASAMPLTIQDPSQPPSYGAVLLVPVELDSKEFNLVEAHFYPPKSIAAGGTVQKTATWFFGLLGGNDTKSGGTDIQEIDDPNTNPAIMKVTSLFPLKTGADGTAGKEKILIEISENTGTQDTETSERQNRYVDISVRIEDITTGVGATQNALKEVVNQQRVPNNLTVIGQILEGSGVLKVSITQAGIDGPGGISQPVGIPNSAGEVALKRGERQGTGTVKMQIINKNKATRVRAGETKLSVTFSAKGKVLDCVQRALDKFFACILYVDEFNIAHIRPRYKMLQLESDPNTPPIWGLYGGQPVYPRLFKATWKDKLKITPNSVIVFGQQANGSDPYLLAKADHGLLQGQYGEFQVLDDKPNDNFNSKFEAYNCAKNKLLSYIRSGYSSVVECDIIPNLRPGHRIDVADFVTGMVGGFLIEHIQWEYAKESGMKMNMTLSSQMLVSDDSFTVAAISLEGNFDKSWAAITNSKGSGREGPQDNPIFQALNRQKNIEQGKGSSGAELDQEVRDIYAQREIYQNRDLPFFDLEDKGKIKFKPRDGFEKPINPEKLKD